MSNLTYTKSEIGLEVIILNDGSAYCTQSSYARFSGKTQQAISARLANLQTIETEDLEGCEKIDTLVTTKKFVVKTRMTRDDGKTSEVCLIPAEQFGLMVVKDNPDLGLEIIKAGATQFLYKVAGYEIKASLPKPEPKPVQLPPADIRINDYVQNIKFLGIDVENPRYSQYIKDLVLNEIIGVNKALPESTEVWLGVAEKAEKLGYPVSLVVKYRSPLGKFVKACVDEYNLEFTQEERLVNGRGTLIGLYKDCDALTQVVSEFMDAKVLTTN